MRIATLFSGIGAPEQGAKRVYGEDLEMVFACEWDKFARQSFKANYEIADEHFHEDISDMDGTQYEGKVDILIGGSPCQDFSLAGLRKGIDGNKGILIYEYIRIVEEVKAPVIVYENVKGMLSDKGGRTVKDFVQALRDIGYYCHYEVLNTKDYGVPQNRERIYLIGFLDADMYHRFQFAPKQKLVKRLKDVLESDVEEKYYIDHVKFNYSGGDQVNPEYSSQANSIFSTDKEAPTLCAGTHGYAQGYIKVPSFKEWFDRTEEYGGSKKEYDEIYPKLEGVIGMLDIKGNDSIRRVYGVAPCLTTMGGGNREPKIAAMRGRNPDNSSDRTVGGPTAQRLELNHNGTSNCLTSVQKDNYVIEPKIQVKSATKQGYEEATLGDSINLTHPDSKTRRGRVGKQVAQTLDCACNQAVVEDYRIRKLTPRECFRLQDFPDTFKQVVSNSQAYKQAGNSMSANVLEMIFRQIEKAKLRFNTNTLLDFLGATA